MIIANRSIHIIDYENNRILSRDIPATFDEYVGELIEHINRNDSVRDYKTRSRYTEVISGAIAISSQKDNADVVRERTNSIANRLLVKEVEAQGHIGRLNTNVQKGSLIQALLFDEQEHKHVYLLAKVEHSTFVDDVDFSFKTGFSKDKKTIWKSCLIDLPPEESDEYYAKVYSNTSAKFWSDDFLELDEMISDETNTLKSFKAIETVLNTNLRGVATKDHTVLRNGFIAYYKGQSILARNIISLHCRYSALTDLDEKTLSSIQSNYQIYLKDNVSQYIDLKNKLAQFICDVVSKTGDYATMLLGDLKKNLIAIFGFLFTVILANIVSDQPLQNIFTREITVILEVVIAGSVIYLIICHIESQYKLCKIKRTYYLLKDNYKGLLSDVDLQESFNGDKIITDTVRSVERGIWIYTIIWFVFLIVLLLILEHISSSPVITIWINNAVSFFHEIAKSGAH